MPNKWGVSAGVFRTAGDPNTIDHLPEQLQEPTRRFVASLSLTPAQRGDLVQTLLSNDQGSLIYPIHRVIKAYDIWKNHNLTNRGFGIPYFVGILKRINADAVIEAKYLDGLPPVVEGD